LREWPVDHHRRTDGLALTEDVEEDFALLDGDRDLELTRPQTTTSYASSPSKNRIDCAG